MYKCVAVKLAAMFIKNCFIVDKGGAKYVGGLFHVFNPPISIHTPIWFVLECPVQWKVEVDIFGVLLGLVHTYGWHKALPIGLGKYK